MASKGKLTLVATPIGNLGDLSPRGAEALSSADFWCVEDTRISGKLASALGIKKAMRVLNEHTSEASIEKLADEIAAGGVAALATDGGCPVISDPGALLVDRCLDLGVQVDAVPGASAVTQALMLSGFFAQRFVFLGFLPRRPGPMREELRQFANSPLTIVLFESPFRIENLLKVAGDVLPGRRYALCRELTKLHQQVFRGILPTIPSDRQVPRRGEYTIVIEGIRRKRADDVCEV